MINQINMFKTAYIFSTESHQERSSSIYVNIIEDGNMDQEIIIDMELTMNHNGQEELQNGGVHPLILFLNLMDALSYSTYQVTVRVDESKRLYYVMLLGQVYHLNIYQYNSLNFEILGNVLYSQFLSNAQLRKVLDNVYRPHYYASSVEQDLFKVILTNEVTRFKDVGYAEKKLFNSMSVYAENRQVRKDPLLRKEKKDKESKGDKNEKLEEEEDMVEGSKAEHVSQIELEYLEENSMRALVFGFIKILPRSECIELEPVYYENLYKSLKIRALEGKVTATFDSNLDRRLINKMNANLLNEDQRQKLQFKLAQRKNKKIIFSQMEEKLKFLGHRFYNNPWTLGKDGLVYKFVLPNVLDFDDNRFNKVVYLRNMPALGLKPRAHFNYRSEKLMPDSLLFLRDLSISINEYEHRFQYTKTGEEFSEFVNNMEDHFINHVYSKLCLDSQVKRITLIYEMAHKLIFNNPVAIINLAAQPGTDAFIKLEEINRNMLQELHHEDTEDLYLHEYPSYYFMHDKMKLNNENTAAGQPHRTYLDVAKRDLAHPYHKRDIQKMDFKFDAYGVADQIFSMWKDNWRDGIDDAIMQIYNIFPEAFLSNAVPKDEVYHVRKIDGPGTRTIYSTSLVSIILTMPFLNMVEEILPPPHRYQYVKQWMRLSTSGSEYHHVLKEFIEEASLNGFAYRVMADNMYIITYDMDSDEFDYYSLDGAKFEVSTTGNYLSALFKVIIEEWFSDGDYCNFNQDWQSFIIYMMPRLIAQYYNKDGELVLSPVAVLGDRVFKPSQLLSGSAGTKLINTFRMMTVAKAMQQSPNKDIQHLIFIAQTMGIQLTIESNFKFVGNLVEKQIYETDILGYNTILYEGFYRPILKYDSLVNIMLFPKSAYTLYVDNEGLETDDEKVILVLMSYVMLQLGGIVYNNLSVWANQYIRNRLPEIKDLLDRIVALKQETGKGIDEFTLDTHPTLVGILDMLTSNTHEMLKPTLYNDKIRSKLSEKLAIITPLKYIEKKVTIGTNMLLLTQSPKVHGFMDKIVNAQTKQMSKYTFDLLSKFHCDEYVVKSQSYYGRNTAPILVLPTMSINRPGQKNNRLTTIAVASATSSDKRVLKTDYNVINNQLNRELVDKINLETLIAMQDIPSLVKLINAINSDKIFASLLKYIPNSILSQMFCGLVSPNLPIDDSKSIIAKAYLHGEQVIFGDEKGEIIDSETLEALSNIPPDTENKEFMETEEKIFVTNRNGRTQTALRIVLTQYLEQLDSSSDKEENDRYITELADVYNIPIKNVYNLITSITQSLPNNKMLSQFFNLTKSKFTRVPPKVDDVKIRKLLTYYIITASSFGIELQIKTIGSHLDLHGKRVEYAALYLKEYLIAEFKTIPLSKGKILYSSRFESSMKNIINAHPEEFTNNQIFKFRRTQFENVKANLINMVNRKRQERVNLSLMPPDLKQYKTDISSFNLTQSIEEIENLSGLLTLDYRSIDLDDTVQSKKLLEYIRAFFAYIHIYLQPVPEEIARELRNMGYSNKYWLIISQQSLANMQATDLISMENEQDLYVQVMLNRITRDLLNIDNEIKTHYIYNIVENTYRILQLAKWYIKYHFDQFVYPILMKLYNFDHAENVFLNNMIGIKIDATPTGSPVENLEFFKASTRRHEGYYVVPVFVQNFVQKDYDYPPIEMSLDMSLFKDGFEIKYKDGKSTQIRTSVVDGKMHEITENIPLMDYGKMEESIEIILQNYEKLSEILETTEFEEKYMYAIDKLAYINGDQRISEIRMSAGYDILNIYPINMDINIQLRIMRDIFRFEGNFEQYYDDAIRTRVVKEDKEDEEYGEKDILVGKGKTKQTSAQLYKMLRMNADKIEIKDNNVPVEDLETESFNKEHRDDNVTNLVHKLEDIIENAYFHPTVTRMEWVNRIGEQFGGDNIFLNIYNTIDNHNDVRDYGHRLMMYAITSEYAVHEKLIESDMKEINKINVYSERHQYINNLIERNKQANGFNIRHMNIEYVPPWLRVLKLTGLLSVKYKVIIKACIRDYDLMVEGFDDELKDDEIENNPDTELMEFLKMKADRKKKRKKRIVKQHTMEISRMFDDYLGIDNFDG